MNCLLLKILQGFPGGSDGKESACNAGDVGLILSQENPLEEEMATHSTILAWRIPWTVYLLTFKKQICSNILNLFYSIFFSLITFSHLYFTFKKYSVPSAVSVNCTQSFHFSIYINNLFLSLCIVYFCLFSLIRMPESYLFCLPE